MSSDNLVSAIEAILFASGEPVDIGRLAEALAVDKAYVITLAQELSQRYEEKDSALQVIRLDDKFQICTKSEYSGYIRRALDIRRNMPLSQAAMEVLAVISYNQPVTKAFVEKVRGVDCTGVLQSLCQKGLIEEKGRLELPGRPLLYGTTDNFLRCFGISSLDELPELPEQEPEEQQQEEDYPKQEVIAAGIFESGQK